CRWYTASTSATLPRATGLRSSVRVSRVMDTLVIPVGSATTAAVVERGPAFAHVVLGVKSPRIPARQTTQRPSALEDSFFILSSLLHSVRTARLLPSILPRDFRHSVPSIFDGRVGLVVRRAAFSHSSSRIGSPEFRILTGRPSLSGSSVLGLMPRT